MLMYNQDLPYVLKPRHIIAALPENIWRMATASLATFNDITAAAICHQIPHATLIIQYGRVSHLGSSDRMQ